ncbi:hypothetical protein V1279_007139 [Bradyrhizobium sp. AZCC 1610]|uniref:hypothetical protein n=1 Tax=Bradyrhizobium sp. AZCC 1610 TaxID=3117020 RepID=UPI002FEFFB03
MDRSGLHRLRIADRADLSGLLIALNGAKSAVRTDECGDWIIAGSRGHIRACDRTFTAYVGCGSAMGWTVVKKQLAGFTAVHQDGDQEGILTLTRLPDADEAARLRHYVGLRQTHEARGAALHPDRKRGPSEGPLQAVSSRQTTTPLPHHPEATARRKIHELDLT